MTIEITIPLIAHVGMSFDIEPGRAVTREMIDKKINSLQLHLDRGAVDAGPCSMYVQVVKYDSNVPIDGYDRESGRTLCVEIDSPLGSPDRDGHELHHDIGGWYIVSPDEERDEQGYGPDGVSLGFDGRDHYATEAEAWAAFEASDAP